MNVQLVDALIIAKRGNASLFDSLVREIESLEGKIKHAFPPVGIIASVSSENIKELLNSVFVGYLTTDAIEEPPALIPADESRDIISIWNNQVRVSRETEIKAPADEDLSWDAPGYLPPDPPPHIRKMMDEWERGNEKEEDCNE